MARAVTLAAVAEEDRAEDGDAGGRQPADVGDDAGAELDGLEADLAVIESAMDLVDGGDLDAAEELAGRLDPTT